MDNPLKRLVGSQDTWNDILGIFFLVASLLLLGSLLTFDPADLSWLAYPAHFPAHNFAGAFGAHFAGISLFLVGLAAYWIPILVLIWAMGRFWQNSFWRMIVKLYGSIVLVFSTAAILSLLWRG